MPFRGSCPDPGWLAGDPANALSERVGALAAPFARAAASGGGRLGRCHALEAAQKLLFGEHIHLAVVGLIVAAEDGPRRSCTSMGAATASGSSTSTFFWIEWIRASRMSSGRDRALCDLA